MSEALDQEWLGEPIEDASEETFLLFSQHIPPNSLGFVDGSASTIDVEIGNRTLSLKQSPGVLHSNRSAGTTGAVLWKITPLVAEWLASLPHCLKSAGVLHGDAVIVELGCGTTGLIGIMMAPLIASYLLTDQAYVMKILSENISENAVSIQTRSRKKRNTTRDLPKPTFVALDWETDKAAGLLQEIPKGKAIDLVVVCDCVYNEHLIKPLVETMADVCGLTSSKDKPTYALIAQQLRSDEVFEQFLEALMINFNVWRIPDDKVPTSLRLGMGYVVHLACLKAQ